MSPQFNIENSNKLAERYLSKSFEQVHQSWSGFVPSILRNSFQILAGDNRLLFSRWQINALF